MNYGPSLPVEEIFTNVDVIRSINYDRNLGYTFEYPRQWLDNNSGEKMIGVRRLELTPTSHIFELCLRFYDKSFEDVVVDWYHEQEYRWGQGSEEDTYAFDEKPRNWFEGDITDVGPMFVVDDENLEGNDENVFDIKKTTCGKCDIVNANAFLYKFRYQCWYGVIAQNTHATYNVRIWYNATKEKVKTTYYVTRFSYIVKEKDSLEHILHQIIDDVESIKWEYKNENDEIIKIVGGPYSLIYDYDKSKGSIRFKVIDGGEDDRLFEMRGFGTNLYPDLINDFCTLKFFLKFLNQDINIDNHKLLILPSFEKHFQEIWNRNVVQFHASFSYSSRQYIGLGGDFWQQANRLYHFNNTSTFNVRFSNDGVNFFLPRYSQFIIELTFSIKFKKKKT